MRPVRHEAERQSANSARREVHTAGAIPAEAGQVFLRDAFASRDSARGAVLVFVVKVLDDAVVVVTEIGW